MQHKSFIFQVILLYFNVLLCSFTPVKTASPTQAFSPGQTVPESYIKAHGYEGFFTSTPIPDSIFRIMKGKSYKADCTVPRKSLRYIRCLHRNIEGQAIVGEMVVNKAIANDVVAIFKELYRNKYPIERMRLIDYWDADDERSMSANNSSAFNFRFISHTRTVSKHGKGMAVDINTLYNPYHRVLRNGKEIVEPAAGKPYLDRSKNFPYKITKGDLCYRLFIKHGFRWGGDWKNSKDYQHFEK
ncbi:M15 family metallopeptidase [uncultured Bacteroides sp.]|uniref:M15 family metallopeptidase n=1 Tax=uncultured Bacteroides sp. TaxID=162156 RepID=UPI00261F02BB|nr:M15 family metallopeptidase [uncultured Bacteroides sp.]